MPLARICVFSFVKATLEETSLASVLNIPVHCDLENKLGTSWMTFFVCVQELRKYKQDYEFLEDEQLDRLSLMGWHDAIRAMHEPRTEEEQENGRRRFIFQVVHQSAILIIMCIVEEIILPPDRCVISLHTQSHNIQECSQFQKMVYHRVF